MHLPLLQRLYAHMEWADAIVWRAVLAEDVVGRDDYVIDSMIHLHMVQQAYLAVWKSEKVLMPSRDDFDDLFEILDWGRSYYAEALGFLRQLAGARLGEIVPIPWADFIERELGGPLSPTNLGDMVLQVATHSAHHRAQINRRIREVGGTPGMVDYIVWVWQGEPAADWAG